MTNILINPLFVALAGTALGTVISLPTAGLIAANPQLGWEGIFYLHGGLSIIWCIVWAIFVTDSPHVNKFVSNEERDLISKNRPALNQVRLRMCCTWFSIEVVSLIALKLNAISSF